MDTMKVNVVAHRAEKSLAPNHGGGKEEATIWLEYSLF